VLNLNPNSLRRNYKKWGPSARTCVLLSRVPNREMRHERDVSSAARAFVLNPDSFLGAIQNATTMAHILFSVRPGDESEDGRRTLVAEIATDHIKEIISYAAADALARKRIEFYQKMSNQPMFKSSAGQMFERFVLSWLASHPSAVPLQCTPSTFRTTPEIPACGEERTVFFGSLTALKKKVKVVNDALPWCFLPTSQTPDAVDAIVFTNKFIITVQVTIAEVHSTNRKCFDDIEESIRGIRNKRKWCHVFITDDNCKARSLRGQTLSDLPKSIFVYSAVFDVGRLDITRVHVESFDEKKVSETGRCTRLVLIGGQPATRVRSQVMRTRSRK
jgi:hypothetical protein